MTLGTVRRVRRERLRLSQHSGRVADNVSTLLDSLVAGLGKNQMTAYLVEMGVRLIELHRVIKPTGSLYLHCDPSASHYLKILMDAILGPENFRNEIIYPAVREERMA